jgi:hypothetical protein
MTKSAEKSKPNIKVKILHIASLLNRYSVYIFLAFIISIYGFLAFRAISLDQADPDAAAVSAKLKTAGVPHIDSDVIQKIQQLQDNSVSVQSLFDQARSNPFQE